jgi:cytochrome c-type biogenesis protein CcmH
MSWILALMLALIVLVALILLRVPRAGWEAIAAALLLGIAGYGLQGSPNLMGSPRTPAQSLGGDPAALVAERQKLAGAAGTAANRHLIIADALARNRRFGDAAEVLRGAVAKNPGDGEAWLAMANALVEHADGMLTPASLYAYQQSTRAAPGNPAPPYFLGLALAQSGRLAEARAIWAQLLGAAPAQAPWRAELAEKLGRLDELIARQAQGAAR